MSPAIQHHATRGLQSPYRAARAAAPRIAGRVASALLVLLAVAGLSPAPASAACQVESLELPVRMSGSRAVAMVGINGVDVPLMVDSGAFFSFLTDAAAAQLKLTLKRAPLLRVEGVTGRVDTQLTTVDKLKLFKGDIDRVQFVVGGNEPGAGTLGIMGRNILSFTDTEYDLAHGVIRFLFPSSDCDKANMAYWAGSTPVTELDLKFSRDKTPAIRADVKINGASLVALFDTGATTLVSGRAARRAGVEESAWKPYGTVYGGGRGSSKEWTAAFDRFEIGGEVISHNRLAIAEVDLTDADLLLGIDFFLSHRIYVSNKQSKLFITYNGGPVFALDRVAPLKTDATPAGPAADAAGAAPAGADVATADQLARRGAASAARRDFDSALADLDRAVALEPASAALFTQRGLIQESLRQPAKAGEDFDHALELDSTQTDARFHRVLLRLTAKDRDGARADLDVLDQAIAPQAQMRLAMAQFYLVLQQPARTLAQLNQWIPAHPNEVTREGALHLRCSARLALGIELDQALDDCDDAIDRNGKNAVYLDTRGWVQWRLGKDRKAVADFDRSLELRPANAGALYGRSLAKTRGGNAVEGSADLAAARKLTPDIERRMAVRSGVSAEATTQP